MLLTKTLMINQTLAAEYTEYPATVFTTLTMSFRPVVS
jgi:hypothetical protein